MVGDLDELIAAALATEDDDVYWELVVRLHRRGDLETLIAARTLVASPDPARRTLGADIAAQLGIAPLGATLGRTLAEHPLHAQCLALLLALAESEVDADTIAAIACGLGHRGDPRGTPVLCGWVRHPSEWVRFCVADSLGGRDEPAAYGALITMSADADADVRNWATFGLAQLTDTDFPALRDALAARLDDPDLATSEEALWGLAIRGDARAVPPMLRMLAAPDAYTLDYTEPRAALAAATGDQRLIG
jgi:HEAT repeat protein